MKPLSLQPTVLVTLLALAPSPVAAADQNPPSQVEEERVLVFRVDGEQRVDLEAVAGTRGYLGVGLLDLTPELRRHFAVPEDRGVMISKVVTDSPAERSGLLPADILTAVDGEPISGALALSMQVARADEGDEVELERWRSGRRANVRVRLEARSRSQVDLSPLIRHRIDLRGPERLKLEGSTDLGGDPVWIEQVIETVDDSFSGATFIQQLEALRQERAALLAKLEQMEGRLSELEAELARLDRRER